MNLSVLLLAGLISSTPDALLPRDAADVVEDESRPPEAAPADQALWRRGKESTRLLHAVRVSATRLAQRFSYQGTEKRLDGLARAGDERAKVIHQQVMSVWKANNALLKSQWPVDPTRGCGYEIMHFEAAIQDTSAEGASRLMPRRKELVACLERADGIRNKMDQSNKAFEAAIVEAERHVAAVAAATGKEAREAEHTKHEAKEHDHDKGHDKDRDQDRERGTKP